MISSMKLSKYNIVRRLESGNYFVFNSFSSATLIINQEDFDDFQNLNANNSFFQDWKNNLLIISDTVDEEEILEKERQHAIYECKKQIFTIIPTSRCNARCFYCFEEKSTQRTMSLSSAQSVVSIIKSNINGQNELHIHWFGGEPLLNTQCIDYITTELRSICEEKNIKYTSSFVTNGSLITPDILKKMNTVWNTISVQVSLDGTRFEYEKRKNYCSKKYSFDLILKNLQMLSCGNFNKSIRINFDKKNFHDCLELVDLLCEKIDRIENFHIYFAELYGNSLSDGLISEREINNYFDIIYNKLIDKKLIRNIKYFMCGHSSRHCQSDGFFNYVIDTDGQLYKCVHDMREPLLDVLGTELTKKETVIWTNTKTPTMCKECRLLPICQGGCKTRNANGRKAIACSGCYVYKNSMDAIFNAVLRLYGVNDRIAKKQYNNA